MAEAQNAAVEVLDRKKRRYMAQLLEEFERIVEPLVPNTEENEQKVKSFKALARRKINALATDAKDLYELGDMRSNGHAEAIKERLHPETQPR